MRVWLARPVMYKRLDRGLRCIRTHTHGAALLLLARFAGKASSQTESSNKCLTGISDLSLTFLIAHFYHKYLKHMIAARRAPQAFQENATLGHSLKWASHPPL